MSIPPARHHEADFAMQLPGLLAPSVVDGINNVRRVKDPKNNICETGSLALDSDDIRPHQHGATKQTSLCYSRPSPESWCAPSNNNLKHANGVSSLHTSEQARTTTHSRNFRHKDHALHVAQAKRRKCGAP